MSVFPVIVLVPSQVKALRDRVVAGDAPLTPAEILALIGSHEHLRAAALAARNKLLVVEEERARLLGQIEMIARAR